MPVLTHAAEAIHDRKDNSLTEVKIADAAQGIVDAIVSVTGVLDDVGDIIEPGAYAETLKQRVPKGVWSHDWDTPVAKTLEAVELMPGDPRLPTKIQALGGGGLMVRMQFNLNTQRGRDAYEDVKFFGDASEWSIGYIVPTGHSVTDNKTGVRRIKSLDLFEYSPVLFGAMAHTVTMSVKGAVGTHSTAAKDGAWDGPAQVAKLPSDASSSELRHEFAWADPDGDPSTKAAYKFPHHFVSDGAVGAASVVGCQAAIASLNGARGGSSIPDGDRKGVYAHLAKHLRDAGVDDIAELKAADGETPPSDQIGKHRYQPPEGAEDDPSAPCLVCGMPKDDPSHDGMKSWDAEETEVKKGRYDIRKTGKKWCVYNVNSGDDMPGGCHPTRAEAVQHMRALYANVPAAADDGKAAQDDVETKDITGVGDGTGTDTNPDPDHDGDDDRVNAYHVFLPMYGNARMCSICRNPKGHKLHKKPEDLGKSALSCADHFTIEVAGVESGIGHCERAFGHEGPHGFYEEEATMDIKTGDRVVGPDGKEVPVEHVPNETETDAARALTEDFQAKLEADAGAEKALSAEEVVARKEEILMVLGGRDLAELEALAAPVAAETKDGEQEAAKPTPEKPTTAAGEAEATQGANTEKKKPLVTNPAMVRAGVAALLKAAVSQDVADAITKIDELVDDLMDKLGIPDTDDDDDDGEKAAAASLEEKVGGCVQYIDNNEDGICDQCGEPKSEHSNPMDNVAKTITVEFDEEGKAKPHPFLPKKGDTAVCAICGKAKDDPAHDMSDDGKSAAGEETKAHTFVPLQDDNDTLNMVCAKCGKTANEEIHNTAKTSEASTETKANVVLAGSYEDILGRVQSAALGGLPPTDDGIEQIAYVEATFPDRVLLAVAQFQVTEDTEDGPGDIKFLGQQYLSFPYTVTEGQVDLGKPDPVEVAGVVVPKSGKSDEVATKTIQSIENKVGRTLSSANAEKVRAAILTLMEVAEAAGIDMTPDEKSAQEDMVTISVVELMEAKMMALRVGI